MISDPHEFSWEIYSFSINPQTKQLKATRIYYSIGSVGQESRQAFTELSAQGLTRPQLTCVGQATFTA